MQSILPCHDKRLERMPRFFSDKLGTYSVHEKSQKSDGAVILTRKHQFNAWLAKAKMKGEDGVVKKVLHSLLRVKLIQDNLHPPPKKK